MESTFLRLLPAELRLAIYVEVLSVDTVTVTLDKPSDRIKRCANTGKADLLAIRATCKAIYLETEGLMFKVNDSWRFVHPNDDTRSWGKRVQAWCSNTGALALQRTKAVQFDIGAWITCPDGPQRQLPGDDATREVGAMFSELPVVLRRPSVKQSIRLDLDWTDGISLGFGRRNLFSNLTLIVPMWARREEILSVMSQQIEKHGRRAHSAFRYYRDCWQYGSDEGYGVPLSFPPEYNHQGPKIYRELRTAQELAIVLKYGLARFFSDDMLTPWETTIERNDSRLRRNRR